MNLFACILRANGRLSALLETRSYLCQKMTLNHLKKLSYAHSLLSRTSPPKELLLRVHRVLLGSFFQGFCKRVIPGLVMKRRLYGMALKLLKKHFIRRFIKFCKQSTNKPPFLRRLKVFVTTIENIVCMKSIDYLMILAEKTAVNNEPRFSLLEKRSSKGSYNRYETITSSVRPVQHDFCNTANGINISPVDDQINEWFGKRLNFLKAPGSEKPSQKHAPSAKSACEDDISQDLDLKLHKNKLKDFQSSTIHGNNPKSPNYKSGLTKDEVNRDFFFQSYKDNDLKSSARYQTNAGMKDRFDSSSRLNLQMYGTDTRSDQKSFLNALHHRSNSNPRKFSSSSVPSMVISAVVAIFKMITDHLYSICQAPTPKTKKLEDNILSKLEEILIFVERASPVQLSQNASSIYALLEELYSILQEMDVEDHNNLIQSKYSTISRLNASASNLNKVSLKELVLNRYKGSKTSTDLPLNEATKNLPIKVRDFERTYPNVIQPQAPLSTAKPLANGNENNGLGRKKSNQFEYYSKKTFSKIILEESASDSKPIRKTLTMPVRAIELHEPTVQLDSISSHSDSIDQFCIKDFLLFLNQSMRRQIKNKKKEAFACLKTARPIITHEESPMLHLF